MVETLWDKITQFVSPEAGQARTRALNEAIGYYIPPEMRGVLSFIGEATPSAAYGRAAQASQQMFAPGQTPMQRLGSAGGMLSSTAEIAAPFAVANRIGMPIAQAAQEGLLGFSVGAQDVGRAVVDRLNQPGPMPTTLYSTPLLWRGEVPEAATERQLERAVEAVPALENILPYVTAEEAATITSRTAPQLEAAYRATSIPQLMAATVEGSPKIGWYRESSNALNTIFGDDTRRFATLLAALSPQTSVEMNLINAIRTFANWEKAGRPKDPDAILDIMGRSVLGDKGPESVLDAWKNNAIRALSAPEGTPGEAFRLSGPKVDSFGFAVSGDLDRYTNDAWMANATGVPQALFSRGSGQSLPGYSPGYLGASAAGRTAASRMSDILGETVAPSEVQEGTWSFAKALYEQAAEGRPSGGPSALDIYQQGLLSPSRIADVPDFATLLQDPRYGGPLREIGYGSNIDAAARAAAAIGSRDLSAAANPAAAADVARRLDALYGHRQFVSSAAPFRAGSFNPEFASSGRQGFLLPYREPSRGYVPLEGGGSGRRLEPSPEYARTLEAVGASPVTFVQLKPDTESRRAFVRDMSAAQTSRGPIGRSVDVYGSPSAYKGYQLFKSEDGTAGFAISPSGELSSVVSAKGSPHRGFSDAVLAAAVQNGAKWLMAFDTVLPQKYARFGFKPVARLPFNEEIARSDMGDEAAEAFMSEAKAFNNGRPDVVFMVYDPNFTDTVANNVGGQITDDFDKAMTLVDRAISRTGAKRGQTSNPSEE